MELLVRLVALAVSRLPYDAEWRRPPHDGSGPGGGTRIDPVYGPGQVEVELGDSTGVVGDQGQRHPVIANVDIGMVVRLFSEKSDGPNEVKCSHKSGTGHGLDQHPPDQLPLWSIGCGQCCEHVVITEYRLLH